MLGKLKKTLNHLFVPQESNNFRGQYLHHDFLTTVIAVMLIVNVGLKLLVKNYDSNILGVAFNITAEELLNATNAERLKYDLPPLQSNDLLMQAASAKANDVFTKNYWAHYAPDGTSPWFFFQQAGYQYVFAGENLAKDFTDSQSVVNAWMNSPTHRDNILKADYQDIGFAIMEGTLQDQPTVLVVQLFGRQEGAVLAEEKPMARYQEPVPAKTVKVAKASPKPVVKTQTAVKKQPLINILSLQKELLLVVLAGLIIVLSLDLYFVEKKKLFRLSGKSLAHLMFTLLLILSIITTSSGVIL
ncbi:hypothetical protein A2313_01945 [Candidatus Roizmanbacteria bacterium RIFOXYB2_FULL_41_10]|uniref:SCP domain-containing protein n=1 Tax=Candidatus Roizmanbacteria bacterium RIFOXYA1_FULL_41_12 TaxID=1802082 RepID=A0A1F7KA54_9BACT|nr:MAG: hypothetical protein A2209_00195 [Candidatus Roizmanbacteria bacterium RIFOXYA1_FULL_41_12]OGK66693.1 MAG: hypothetical protein A2262_03590 [Candidatus Roizmanbacteria bacterium RIFOXYA2_FULL_41_8]OGK67550.1 MAG: hypothetical protein A2377_01750 [Candidatus Roizmanbacteria bacterium RIFOXYB1_FULL_41_27]OGK70956.1 MAG: hypothetical protein A2313_01945 [Candidatus Roizmanbacteria bacterium RIFOXYB2_FULL_41_10]OGK71206.1 MAG: hypothetical protein A2403_00480 [Candidatus Roizmanbacteria bac